MDTAFCLKDDKPWDAKMLSDEAKKQPDQWLIDRRQTFLCRGCEQKARFIDSKARNPHFGVVPGREHDNDCDFRDDPTGGLGNGGRAAPAAARPRAAGNKEVRYDAPGPLNPTGTAGTNGGNNQAAASQTADNGPLHETTGLKTLLKNLRNGEDYPPENLWLDVPARGTGVGSATRATAYFRKIADLTSGSTTDGVVRAFWGRITGTDDYSTGAEGKETLWIYCDRIGSVFTIRLEYDVKDDLYQTMGIESGSELNGAHIIIEGIMKQGKKLSVNVTDIKKIAFLPKR